MQGCVLWQSASYERIISFRNTAKVGNALHVSELQTAPL